jgi:hypothetical protein
MARRAQRGALGPEVPAQPLRKETTVPLSVSALGVSALKGESARRSGTIRFRLPAPAWQG